MSVNQTTNYVAGTNGLVENISYIQPDPFRNLLSPNFGYQFPTSPYIKLSPRKVSYTANTLGTTTHIYTSPYYDDIVALARYFGDWSCAYEIAEGPTQTITVNAPWDTIAYEDFNVSLYASEQWELSPTMESRPLLMNGLLENPYNSYSEYSVLPDIYAAGVQKAIDNKVSLATTLINASSASAADYADWLPLMQQSLKYMRGGIESVPAYTQTLKRTAVIDKNNSNGAFNTAADAAARNLNKQGTINFIYSTWGLINNYSIPRNTVANFLLPSYTKKITITGIDPIDYYANAGWLVKPASFQFIGRNKIQMTQEFLWNEWAQGMYYIYSSPDDFPAINY